MQCLKKECKFKWYPPQPEPDLDFTRKVEALRAGASDASPATTSVRLYPLAQSVYLTAV